LQHLRSTRTGGGVIVLAPAAGSGHCSSAAAVTAGRSPVA
jgi:hypothetical protein